MPAVRAIVRDAGAPRLPFLVARARHRQQRPVPDAGQGSQEPAGHAGEPLIQETPRRAVMFITRLSLPRRTFLQGMGVTLALPLLDAMVPAMTAQSRTAAAPVRRFGAVYVPHGAILNQWTPAAAGHGLRVHADPEAARALPRSPVRRQRPGRPQGSGGGRPRHGAGDVADRHLAQEDRGRGRPQRDHHRPDDRQGRSARTRRSRRSSSPPRTSPASSAPATSASAAPT